MQTVESLIRELQKFPSGARCHAYEGEGITRADGKTVHSYVVISTMENALGDLGCIPCTEDDELDGPAVDG